MIRLGIRDISSRQQFLDNNTSFCTLPCLLYQAWNPTPPARQVFGAEKPTEWGSNYRHHTIIKCYMLHGVATKKTCKHWLDCTMGDNVSWVWELNIQVIKSNLFKSHTLYGKENNHIVVVVLYTNYIFTIGEMTWLENFTILTQPPMAILPKSEGVDVGEKRHHNHIHNLNVRKIMSCIAFFHLLNLPNPHYTLILACMHNLPFGEILLMIPRCSPILPSTVTFAHCLRGA